MTERVVIERAPKPRPVNDGGADANGSPDAARWARELWGLEGTFRRLPGERDENFHVAGSRGEFVFKIAGAAEREETLALQAAALRWLAERAPELPLPRVVPASDGREAVLAERADGSRRWVRVLTYLPGTILADANPRTPAMLEAVGAFFGRLDAALEGFTHPAARGSDLVWNPALALEVVSRHRDAIADPDRARAGRPLRPDLRRDARADPAPAPERHDPQRRQRLQHPVRPAGR